MNKINFLASIARTNGIETTNRLRDDIVSEYTNILESLDTIDESIIVKDISLLPVYKIEDINMNESYIEEETEIVNESLSIDYQGIMSFNIGNLGKVYSVKYLKRIKTSHEKSLNKYETKLKEFKKMNDAEKQKLCTKINVGNTTSNIATGIGTGMISGDSYMILSDKITPYNYPKIVERMIKKLKHDIRDIDKLIKQKEKLKGIKEGYAIDLDSLKYIIESKEVTLKEAIQEIRDINYIDDTYPMYCVLPRDINENMSLESFINVNESLINSEITPVCTKYINEDEFINEGLKVDNWNEAKVRRTLKQYEENLEDLKIKKQKFEKKTPKEQQQYCIANNLKVTTVATLLDIPTMLIGGTVYILYKTWKGDNTSLGPNNYKKQLNELIAAHNTDIKALKKRLKELESQK